MITIYGMRASGNCYKVQLVADQLGIGYRWVDIDSTAGQTHAPTFLALNPNAKVPVMELDDGRVLAESNAIIAYLGEGSALWPADRWQRAQMLQWMFFEQYSHEPCIAVARFICRWLPREHPRRAQLPALRERGRQALAVMEGHLREHAWFSGEHYGLADVALFAYTHCAEDGGIALDAVPAVRAWLQRVREQPLFTPMQA